MEANRKDSIRDQIKLDMVENLFRFQHKADYFKCLHPVTDSMSFKAAKNDPGMINTDGRHAQKVRIGGNQHPTITSGTGEMIGIIIPQPIKITDTDRINPTLTELFGNLRAEIFVQVEAYGHWQSTAP